MVATTLLLPPAICAEPWFGLKRPGERESVAETHREAYRAPDLASRSSGSDASGDPYADIRGEEIYGYLEDITALTLNSRPAGENYWGRIAGSAAELATAEYLAERFREFGMDEVALEPVKGGPQWWPVRWQVVLIGDESYGAGTRDHDFTSAFPALHLAEGEMDVDGLEAELIYVGLGRPVDLLDRDLAGKVAVIHSVLRADPFFQSARGRIQGLVDAGAAGVITVVDGPGNHQYALENMGSLKVPCFLLGGDDGRFLEEAMAAAGPEKPLRVRLSMQSEVREPWQGKNAVGVIRGQLDEYVIILAHLDGYFEGANDNGGGLAAMLALARHYARDDSRPRRHLMFVGTSGHHEFSEGAKAVISDHPDVLENTVLVFNIEHPSSVQSYFRGPLKMGRMTVPGQLITTTAPGSRSLAISNGNENLMAFYREGIQRYGLVVDSMISRFPTGDAFDFFREGHVVVQLMDANLWFHSTGDRMDTISPGGLEGATRMYAFVLDRIDETDRQQLTTASTDSGRQ